MSHTERCTEKHESDWALSAVRKSMNQTECCMGQHWALYGKARVRLSAVWDSTERCTGQHKSDWAMYGTALSAVRDSISQPERCTVGTALSQSLSLSRTALSHKKCLVYDVQTFFDNFLETKNIGVIILMQWLKKLTFCPWTRRADGILKYSKISWPCAFRVVCSYILSLTACGRIWQVLRAAAILCKLLGYSLPIAWQLTHRCNSVPCQLSSRTISTFFKQACMSFCKLFIKDCRPLFAWLLYYILHGVKKTRKYR